MHILVTYDVDTTSKEGARRLRHVAKACIDYGQRVQNSVFECEVTEAPLQRNPPVYHRRFLEKRKYHTDDRCRRR